MGLAALFLLWGQRPKRGYAPGQAAKTALIAAANAGAVSKESLAIFSSE
jgi:hypothetical protein